MSKQDGGAGSEVHRLLDIVVEEVSLVDRAANQYQFLIVKRSDMAKENEADGGAGTSAAAKAAKVDAATVRAGAVAALDALTQAVEQLGADGELDPETLNQVVADLQDVSQQLAQAAGMDPANAGAQKADDGEGDDDEEDDEGGSAGASRKAADVLKSVRELLGQVKAQLATTAKAAGGDAGAGATAAAVPAAPGAAAAVPAADALTKAIQGITDAVKDLGQRLGKVEKRFGMPNSTPRQERSGQNADDDENVTWPLNMNRPLDRESVGKDISFHRGTKR
jgi:hypothetical protein